jgi:hypothetical protein
MVSVVADAEPADPNLEPQRAQKSRIGFQSPREEDSTVEC